MPTAIWKSRLRSGCAHCDLEVAVEVRLCPLGSGARGGGPAVPTGIWTARRRRRRRMRRRRRRTALIKSNNRHLAGGEKRLHLLAFPFLKFLLKVMLLCYKASSRQVLPNSKHQTLLLKTMVHFYQIEYSKLSTEHQILTDRMLSYLQMTDRIFHGPGKTTSRTYVKCFKKVCIDMQANVCASLHSNLRGGLKVCLQTCEGRLKVCM